MSDDINQANNLSKKTVIKNTFMLYIRMFVLMIIGFITTRVVLRSLGEVDYGLNNAIAGFVSLFGVLTGSLNAAISRYITYELGRGDQKKLNKVFSTSLTIQIIMAIIVSLLVETVGMWFLINHMTIPEDRLFASCWVLHFAVINTFVNLTFVPYSACIISHEKMSVYAYVSIIEGVLQLILAYLISLDVWGDKLIFYSCALCLTSLIVNGIYLVYCRKNYVECRIRKAFDINLIKNIGGFAGWNMIGAASGILKNQGINILFNMFFGPKINAAQGVSNQASGLATKFSNGFMTALNPQITKSYAAGNFDYMYSLVYQGTRMAFALFLIIALPIFIETETLLSLWLVDYPEHTVTFIRLMLITLLVDFIIAPPLVTIMLATGKIRNYQISVGGLQLLSFPIAYIMLKCGSSSELVLCMVVFIALLCMFVRLSMLYRMIKFPVTEYLKNVVLIIIEVIILSSILPIFAYYMLPDGLPSDITVCAISIISAAIVILFVGLTKSERLKLVESLRSRLSHS